MKLMKAALLVFAFALMMIMVLQAKAQSNVSGTADAVITNVKSTALFSRSVKWDQVEPALRESAAHATSVHELKGMLEDILIAVKDRDGLFFDPASGNIIAGHPESADPESDGSNHEQFQFAILENNVRYIRPVAVPLGTDLNVYAQQLRAAVDSLSHGESQRWIVDLRYASGGDMLPVFAGLAPLLDEGLVVTANDNKRTIRDMYTVHNGNFYHNQVEIGAFPPSPIHLASAKIAVLTSSHTSGASEVLAIGFRGRKNTRFFGQPTAGHVFVTKEVVITKDLSMRVAEMMYVDRRGNDYKGSITPDVEIDFVPNANFNADKAIEEASLWLLATPVGDDRSKVVSN